MPVSRANLAFTALITAGAGGALWLSKDFGPRAGLFPWAFGVPVFALSVLLLVLEFRRATAPVVIDPIAARRTAAIFGWIIGYVAAIWALGFALGGPLATLAALKLGGRERWPVTLAITAGVAAFIDLLFIRALHVPFPPGALFAWAGGG